ncbi:MAG: Gfo/Idh/MocA family oxidoreductase [Verrucomicrobia bacterium]|nr:Gfo/Idh/MocA family oxidoreductase [Verrucomicrobiota bacterium]
MKARPISRRGFLVRSGTAAGGFLILKSLHSLRAAPANDRLNVAIIGVGGRGRWFVDTMPKLANVAALCDVNEQRAGNAFETIPKARKFHDFRRMLEEMDREIDGVIVATPDHTHAVATALAIRMGKHVYCEKPLARSIQEARHLREFAARSKVATQLGNQGTASEDLLGRKLDWGDAGEKKWNDFAGVLLVGSKGKIHANGHNTVFTLWPDDAAAAEASRSLPRSPGHEREWLNACKGGPAAASNFNYGGPLSEFVLLGNAATLNPGELVFDCSTGQFVDNLGANRALGREYRKGWSL